MEFIDFKRAVYKQFDALANNADRLYLTKRQKILDLMAKKQDAELESKSYEELAKELEALS